MAILAEIERSETSVLAYLNGQNSRKPCLAGISLFNE
jgi:hypothetical protein